MLIVYLRPHISEYTKGKYPSQPQAFHPSSPSPIITSVYINTFYKYLINDMFQDQGL